MEWVMKNAKKEFKFDNDKMSAKKENWTTIYPVNVNVFDIIVKKTSSGATLFPLWERSRNNPT